MSETNAKTRTQAGSVSTISPTPKPETSITVIQSNVRRNPQNQVFFFRLGGDNPDPSQLSKVRILTTIQEPYYQGTEHEFRQQQRDATCKKVSSNGMEISFPKESNIPHIQLLSAEIGGIRVPICGHAHRNGEDSPLQITEIMSIYHKESDFFVILPHIKTTNPGAYIEVYGIHAQVYARDGKAYRDSAAYTGTASGMPSCFASSKETLLLDGDAKHLQITHAFTNVGEVPLSALISRVPMKKYGKPFVLYTYSQNRAQNG